MFLSNPFLILLILAPWMVGQTEIWTLSPNALVAPVDAQVFTIAPRLFDNTRIIFPHWMVQPVFFFYTILSPILLLAVFFVSYHLVPSTRGVKMILALITVSFLYKWGAPGTDPTRLFQMFWLGMIVLPLLTPLSPLPFWSLATFIVLCTVFYQRDQFAVFWMCLSLFLGNLLSYLLADKGHLQRTQRLRMGRTAATMAGFALLGFWGILSLIQNPFDLESLRPHSYWYFAWIAGLLCLANAWFQPWQTGLWLSLAIFSQGLLLSPSLKISLFVVIAWCLLKMLLNSPLWTELYKRLLDYRKTVTAVLLIAILFSFVQQVRAHTSIRTFDVRWNAVLQYLLNDPPTKNYFIVGEGLPFLAQFYPGNLVKDDSIVLEASEARLQERLSKANGSGILVEGPYIKNLWKDWLSKGDDPDKINNAILTRLILYRGKGEKTRTLQIQAVQNFEMTTIPLFEDLMICKQKIGSQD